MAKKENSRNDKIGKIEEEIKKLQESLEALKKEKAPEKPPQTPRGKTRVKKAEKQKEAVPPKAEKKDVPKPAQPVAVKPAVKPAAPSAARKQWLRFERMVGERWLVWVGAIVVAAGFGIFLKYAFEMGWVNEYARSALGVVCGGLLLWFGEYLFRKKFSARTQAPCSRYEDFRL